MVILIINNNYLLNYLYIFSILFEIFLMKITCEFLLSNNLSTKLLRKIFLHNSVIVSSNTQMNTSFENKMVVMNRNENNLTQNNLI